MFALFACGLINSTKHLWKQSPAPCVLMLITLKPTLLDQLLCGQDFSSVHQLFQDHGVLRSQLDEMWKIFNLLYFPVHVVRQSFVPFLVPYYPPINLHMSM
jgi:hypothetical protein